MRIGAFAETYGIKKSTIRYYTDIKLLIPNSSTPHPIYDEKCHQDMKDILLYKEMGLSIENIQRIKVIERFTVNPSSDEVDEIKEIFQQVLLDHHRSFETIKHQMNLIEHKLDQLQANEYDMVNGISLNAIHHLQCPNCEKAFTISQAGIHQNFLVSGLLTCDCEHSYEIIDGILVQSKLIKSLTKKTYKTPFQITNEQMASVHKYGLATSEIMSKWVHEKGIVFINADIDILLMNVHETFTEDGHYFFCSSDFDSLINLRTKLSIDDIKGHITMILTEDNFPIRKDVGYVIDNGGNIVDMIRDLPIGSTVNQYLCFTNATWLQIHIVDLEHHDVKHLMPSVYQQVFELNGFSLEHTEKACDIFVKLGLMPNLKEDRLLEVRINQYKHL